MTFNINLGFSEVDNKGVKDAEGKQVGMFVGDTVVVGEVSFTGWSFG